MIKVAEGEVDEPAFAYTIGLTASYGHPEAAIIGLGLDDMHWILNALGERVRGGETLAINTPIEGLLDGYHCKLVAADVRWYEEMFGQAVKFYGAPDFRVLQCLWPDRGGRFPDANDFNEALRMRQPLLSA